MSEQDKTSPATGRGNAQAAEDISLAGSPSLATNGDEARSSGNSVPPSQHKSPDRHDQADAHINEEPEPTCPRRGGRIEAPQFELPFEVTEQLRVAEIHADPDVQVRVKMDEEAIAEYAERMREGDTFPAVVVFHDGTQHWLADGFHRLEAVRQAELETITAKVKPGGRREAIQYALGANAGHGLRRTNADKRRAVEIALKEFPDQSDRQIAEMCGVGNQLVGDVRRQVCDSHTSSVRTGRDGKKYTQKQVVERNQRPTVALDPEQSVSPSPADAEEQTSEAGADDPAPAQVPADTVQFQLADGSNFGPATWLDGWIDVKAATSKIRSLESTAKPLVSVDKEACALHQRILIGFLSTLNRELGVDPSHDALHRLAEASDSMACLLRNTVIGHQNYRPAIVQLQPMEADDDHIN